MDSFEGAHDLKPNSRNFLNKFDTLNHNDLADMTITMIILLEKYQRSLQLRENTQLMSEKCLMYLFVSGLDDNACARDDSKLSQPTENAIKQVGVLRRRALHRLTRP